MQHVWGTILLKSLGLDLVHVALQAGRAAHQEMLAGRLDVMFDNLSASSTTSRPAACGRSSCPRAALAAALGGADRNETGLVAFEGESWFAVFCAGCHARRGGRSCARCWPRSSATPSSRRGRSRMRPGSRCPPAEHRKFLQGEIERWSVSRRPLWRLG